MVERNTKMKRFAKLIIVAAVLFLVSASVLDAKKIYAAPSNIDLTKLLPPPPPQDSDITKKEISEILDFQKNRTKQMADLAIADQDVSVFRFADVLGPGFTREKLPFAAVFFNNVLRNEISITDPAKGFWNRPRPYVFDKRVKPCLNMPVNASYPSGHSAAGNLIAIILANMIPENSEAIYGRGWEFAMNRVIGGVHYRSDAEAGRMAATAIAALMFSDSAFRADYAKAKAEIRAALGYETKPAKAGVK
jgi:acid phosphatase (class A)